LTYCFARRLTGSREIAALACLLHAFHGSAVALYYNGGTCYDEFCFFFYFSAFTYYMRIRQAGGVPRPWQIAVLVCLYIAALNSKEMAVTLPVMIGVYELLYHKAENWRPRIFTMGVLGAITAAYVLGATRGPGSLVDLPGYRPVISVASYLRQTRSYLNDLIYSPNGFDNPRSAALLASLFVIAWLSRDRDLKFCFLFLTIGVLPIAFIPPRGLYAVYIPIVGLAIFLAIQLARAVSLLVDARVGASLFVAAALALAAMHARKGAANVSEITTEEHHIRDVIRQLGRLHPKMPEGSRILLVKDPFEGRVWDSTFLLRLFYRDNSLVVDRLADGHEAAKYDYVWTFEDGELVDVDAAK
jgi:hypothetical protein